MKKSFVRNAIASAIAAQLVCSSAAQAIVINVDAVDLAMWPMLGTHAAPGAIVDLTGAAGQAFFSGAFVDIDPMDAVAGFNILGAIGGPTIDVKPLGGPLGLYQGFGVGAMPNTIFIDQQLVINAQTSQNSQELLEATIAHETAHWVDWKDNGANNDPAGAEDGNQFEMAVYGFVKNAGNVTCAQNNTFGGAATLDVACGGGGTSAPVPLPASWALLLSGIGGLAAASKRRRRSTSS